MERLFGTVAGFDIYNFLTSGTNESQVQVSGQVARQKLEWNTIKIDQLKYTPEAPIISIPSAFLADSGLPSNNTLHLYCRAAFHNQFEFLQERVVKEGVLGWILGPPGTGKSTTALAFAAQLDKKVWTVTWIHLKNILSVFAWRVILKRV